MHSDNTCKTPIMAKRPRADELYLDTVRRRKLDFDFEKVCSVTLSNVNIYGCLVCGEYYQGRGRSSPAMYHSLEAGHHLFINFNTLRVYALPEGAVIETPQLDDVKYAVAPTYTKAQLRSLSSTLSTDLNGKNYTPGFIGLNNIKCNTYSNVVLQALCHCTRVRDWCLTTDDQKDELVKRFVTFTRKLWSPKLFKNHISPHELLQHVGVNSNKIFTINEERNPRDFLLWLLNNLKAPIIPASFQGKLRISSHKLITSEENEQLHFSEDGETRIQFTNFWILTLDLPSVSLLRDGFGVRQIPQIRLEKLLEKYDGVSEHVQQGGVRKFEVVKYPPYLILQFERFKDRNLGIDLSLKDRNQTIVEFPFELSFGEVKYTLLSNIVHEFIPSDGLDSDDKSDWKIQLRNGKEWVEINDLKVTSKEKELLFLGETYMQFWQRIR